jgi:peptidoglycan/LPS O-acetylase OafA/YrhL
VQVEGRELSEFEVRMVRFSFVDALRGIAALSVVLYHAIVSSHVAELAETMPGWLRTALEHGDLGVAIFFVLSGFVIAHSLRDQKMSPLGAGRFMLKRSVRLDPPYWVAIATAVAFSALATRLVRSHTPGDFSAAQIISHIFYAQDILGFRDINPIFWTLCLEVQFYLVFAILLMLPGWIFIPVFAVSLLWPLGVGPTVHHGLFPTLWFSFLLGVLSYWAWKNTTLVPAFLVYASLIGIAGILESDSFALTCVVAASALLVAGIAGKIAMWNWRWLQFLGTISYSLYLLHNPITGATFRVGYMMTGHSLVTEALWWPISIAACILAAFGLWYFVERPSLNLARRFSLGSTEIVAELSKTTEGRAF